MVLQDGQGTVVAIHPLPYVEPAFARDLPGAEAATDHIALAWEAASEHDFEGYDIERSADGKAFNRLASVASKGTENNLANYTYEDHTATKGTVWYYRLKLKDKSGNFNYSPVRSAKLEADWQAPLLVPNPTDGDLLVLFKSPIEGAATLRVMDSLGRKHSLHQLTITEGKNTLLLLETDLPNGLYSILLETADGAVRWGRHGIRL